MQLKVKTREEQPSSSLFGGRIHENRPIQEERYSNLIYWAHVEAIDDGEFGMHPHEGIEILTFVFEGSLEHFDTATNAWTPLQEGGVQLIQAGKGVSHAERYKKGSRAFQIWFDPDFSKSLNKPPYYEDFQNDVFQWENGGEGLEVMFYAGEDGPIRTDAPGIAAKRYRISAGTSHRFEIVPENYYSLYLLRGNLKIAGVTVEKDTFLRITGAEVIGVEAMSASDLFILQSP